MQSIILECIKYFVPIVLSWPVVGLIAFTMFRKPIYQILQQFGSGELRKAKVGPIEFEREYTKLEDLGTSLIETIGKSDVAEITPDLIDVGLDSMLKDEAFKGIPFVKMALSFYNTQLAIRNFFLVKKILNFIYHLNNVSSSKKEAFLRKISEDKKHKHRVGENLIFLLDRFDDLEKPAMLAKLFVGYINGTIDYTTFKRLAISVDRTFLDDLKLLKQYYSNLQGSNKERLHHLAQAGLVTFESGMVFDADGIIFKESELGKLFIQLVFDSDSVAAIG